MLNGPVSRNFCSGDALAIVIIITEKKMETTNIFAVITALVKDGYLGFNISLGKHRVSGWRRRRACCSELFQASRCRHEHSHHLSLVMKTNQGIKYSNTIPVLIMGKWTTRGWEAL